jgi:hypothetical protein
MKILRVKNGKYPYPCKIAKIAVIFRHFPENGLIFTSVRWIYTLYLFKINDLNFDYC